MEQRFAGRTVVITGASAGIGAGCARRFVREGANVVLAARHKDKLESFAGGLDPTRTLACIADVRRREDVDRLMRAGAERFGQIDVLVSNAGAGRLLSLEGTTQADWRFVMETNLDSCFHCAQAALPFLKATKGSIVHVASAAGLGGDWSLVAYNAAKGGVVNLTRALAFDLGRFGIRVNAVAPSLTSTDATAEAVENAALLAEFSKRMALEGYASPDDIAAAVAFLASPDARFVTGAILPIDGGITAGSGQPMLG